MKPTELDGFRKSLLEEQRRLNAALEYLQIENPGAEEEETPETGSLEAHLADAGSITLDREIDYTLEESVQESLKAIEAALLRIDEGTYGICENCGAEIGSERLQARPWTTLCIDCKRREERG
jgi:RNA polymerase-binding protein DksA